MKRAHRYVVAITFGGGTTHYLKFALAGMRETCAESLAEVYTDLNFARRVADDYREQCRGESVCVYLIDLDDGEWRDDEEDA